MTCTCKAELASIRSAIVEDVLAAAELCRTSGNKSGADAMDFLAGRISRPPSPAPAEPQEPLTGWMAKCFIPQETSTDFYIAWAESNANKNSPTHWLCEDNQWHGLPHAAAHYMRFPTESAARAALLAASEPGKAWVVYHSASRGGKWVLMAIGDLCIRDLDATDYLSALIAAATARLEEMQDKEKANDQG